MILIVRLELFNLKSISMYKNIKNTSIIRKQYFFLYNFISIYVQFDSEINFYLLMLNPSQEKKNNYEKSVTCR